MDDLIYRQAAIEAVKRLSLGETDAVRLALRLEDYLKRLASAQQWLPCGECVNFVDHRCIVAQHHVSEQSDCSKVFGAKRAGEES